MAITNYFQAENLIKDAVKDMFSSNMIFTGVEIGSLSNDDFTKYDTAEERIGLIIRQAGFKLDSLQGKRSYKQQRIKFFWQIVVVCPSDNYNDYGGLKVIEVMQRLMGVKLSTNFTEMQLIDDERDFNEPEFAKDLAYLPMMFQIDAVLTGAQ